MSLMVMLILNKLDFYMKKGINSDTKFQVVLILIGGCLWMILKDIIYTETNSSDYVISLNLVYTGRLLLTLFSKSLLGGIFLYLSLGLFYIVFILCGFEENIQLWYGIEKLTSKQLGGMVITAILISNMAISSFFLLIAVLSQ
ncbi:MAG: hypothetical protein COW03_02330 [Cytophagales bacterium CG12_big_fil_rev_8_21_14_0_65_40_12]|nr:MAG: hypothetical protein COW03_02330 [Cytophagales bacterium CG12_big_fil_rev_8_21_14_0_65_40_12]PIW02912.1 MAG: hypothetical protein COW40_17615 [Cytophagales bacterium CG17_big_fil_post_rev_8_21_14_2_50_40_13]